MTARAQICSFGSIATLGLASVVAVCLPTSSCAQDVTAGEAAMAPSGRAPLVTQETPPELTPEQRRMREEALRRSNPPGPALPVEPEFQRRSPALPPTDPPR
jgi:hypothetical protein